MALKKYIPPFALLGFMTFSMQVSAEDFGVYEPGSTQIRLPYCAEDKTVPWGPDYSPCNESTVNEWLRFLTNWRSEQLVRIGFDSRRYKKKALQWTQSAFMQPQMMVHDRYFYNPETGYTVDKYVDDLEKRYGGIDAVLIWSTYPNLGIDDRNQLDMVRSMPGGVAGVKKAVDDFHRRGVKVLFPIMPWDTGTNEYDQPWADISKEEGESSRTPDPLAVGIAKLMKEVGADGVNGDTMSGVPENFSLEAEKIGHPLAFQPEGAPSDEALGWNVMTWGQFKFPFTPLVARFKWLEPRHMINISHRWAKNKTDDLQFAFFNGIGWESWENVWGIWNGITERDAEATRRVATIERGVKNFLISPNWQPFFPTLKYGVFASKWPIENQYVLTIVNRNDTDENGFMFSLPKESGQRYFDLYHGTEITPTEYNGKMLLSLDIEAHGFGAVFVTSGEPNDEIKKLMDTMHDMTQKHLSDYPSQWKVLTQKMVPNSPVTSDSETGTPEGMVEIPAGKFAFKVSGTEIEGWNQDNDIGVDVQYPWEKMPRKTHDTVVPWDIASFYMDKTPVTNEQFKKFMDATGYPRNVKNFDSLNFLKDWKDGMYPAGWENKPVTWVSLEDARAYATWAKKRLPNEWEWQYAAQGTDGRLYPWGNDWDIKRIPEANKTRKLKAPDDVNAHPDGASPFGVLDMVGNVWQMTNEFQDDHTRALILRGGSSYVPQSAQGGSKDPGAPSADWAWYFPQAYQNNKHSKYLLMGPSYDRSGMLGFRCVRDKAGEKVPDSNFYKFPLETIKK